MSENYPDLKATKNFQDLQVQLEGTENRIAVSRRNFNEAVQGYNTAVRSFPAVLCGNVRLYPAAILQRAARRRESADGEFPEFWKQSSAIGGGHAVRISRTSGSSSLQ